VNSTRDTISEQPVTPAEQTSEMSVARVVVDVMLKPEILDPQGRAVQGALGRLDLQGVIDVRQGKQFVIDLEGDLDEATVAKLHDIAEHLLSNPVIEDYVLHIEPAGTATTGAQQ